MVTDRKEDSRKTPGKQGPEGSVPEPNRINASTPFDFNLNYAQDGHAERQSRSVDGLQS
jgi:hypothetical protein